MGILSYSFERLKYSLSVDFTERSSLVPVTALPSHETNLDSNSVTRRVTALEFPVTS